MNPAVRFVPGLELPRPVRPLPSGLAGGIRTGSAASGVPPDPSEGRPRLSAPTQDLSKKIDVMQQIILYTTLTTPGRTTIIWHVEAHFHRRTIP